jgi:hypothetical protein
MPNAVIRPDLILSYWIFLWYIAYILRFTKASPKLLLQLGILENLWTMWLIWGYATTENFIYFIAVFLLTKVVPLVTIWRVPITVRDVWWSVALVSIYVIWIYINRNNGSVSTLQSLKENRNLTPGIWLFHKAKSVIKLI